jgi:hypothetical protein
MARPIGRKSNSGGIAAPRRTNGNIDWDIVYGNYIRPTLNSQLAPNTSRGLMYILRSKNILKKTDYHGLTDHLTDWRKDGKIDWDEIADGSGRGVINDFTDYNNVKDFVDDAVDYVKYGGHNYRELLKGRWRWYGQPNYIEFWVEKHAVVGTVATLVGNRYVKVAFNKGDPGWGYMRDNCVRLYREKFGSNAGPHKGKRKIYIFYLGDSDEYGLDMDRQIKVQLQHFGMWDHVHFERIGVIPEQIAEYNLLPNDKNDGYEIDALNAADSQKFKKLIDDHIDPYFDNQIHKKILKEHPKRRIDDLFRDHVNFRDDIVYDNPKEHDDD